jgi:hypothetical protein
MSLALFTNTSSIALPDDGSRIVGDRYYTPELLARRIVAAIHAIEPITGNVLEPHAGGGAFVRALLDLTRARVFVSDINPDAPALGSWGAWLVDHDRAPCGARVAQDFLTAGPPRRDWIIGNPPYADAEAHVRHALTWSRHVVFLLRSAFSESAARIPFWTAHPCRHEWRLAQRPSFTACGRTDSAAYSVFWWDREHTGPTTCTHGWDWKRA